VNTEELLGRAKRIHFEELCNDVADSIRPRHRVWATSGRVEPFIIVWPSEPIPLRDGSALSGPQFKELPDDEKKWPSIMEDEVRRLRAQALLFVHETPQNVRALLETSYSTRAWVYPKEKHGDAWRLGQPLVSDDEEYLSLLWVPSLQMN
jgi:hypothetical protein